MNKNPLSTTLFERHNTLTENDLATEKFIKADIKNIK